MPLWFEMIGFIFYGTFVTFTGWAFGLACDWSKLEKCSRKAIAELLVLYIFIKKREKKQHEQLWHQVMSHIYEARPKRHVRLSYRIIVGTMSCLIVFLSIAVIEDLSTHQDACHMVLTIAFWIGVLFETFVVYMVNRSYNRELSEILECTVEDDGYKKVEALTRSILFKEIVERYSNSLDPLPIVADGDDLGDYKIVNLQDCLKEEEIKEIEDYAAKA